MNMRNFPTLHTLNEHNTCSWVVLFSTSIWHPK